jgi:hypothetical protein
MRPKERAKRIKFGTRFALLTNAGLDGRTEVLPGLPKPLR